MSNARAFIGAGDVMLNPYDPVTGLLTGWVFGGSADKFSVKPNSNIKSKTSKAREQYGQTIATVALPQDADLSITFGEVNKDNIKLAFMGTSRVINTAAGGTITAEAISAKLGVYVPLAHKNLTNAVVVTNSGATVTYVLGTDYDVNYRLGWIRALAGGAITDGLALKVDYVSGAISGTEIAGSTQAQLRTQVMFDGKNFVDGSPAEVEIYEAVLAPSGEFDFLADDWGALELTGKMTTPQGKTEPYTVRFKDQ